MNWFRVWTLSVVVSVAASAMADDVREWTDVTGRFKINARLVEVREGVAFLENASGQTIKIPTSRLSEPDQRFLEVGANPFEVVGEPAMTEDADENRSGATTGNFMGRPVDWSRVREVVPDLTRWKAPVAKSNADFVGRSASLPKKENFHERPHPIIINPATARAVIGHTVSFAVDEPFSRFSLVDLKTGRAVHSDTTPANMKPIALLDDGTSLLAVGVARRKDDGETADTVQLWRLRNRRISKSSSWIPYPDEDKSFGKMSNDNVVSAGAIDDDIFYTISEHGHLAVWNKDTGRAVWHLRMSERHFDVALSPGRELIAIVDEKTVSLVEAKTGFVVGGTQVPGDAAMNWPKIRWSPERKACTFSAATKSVGWTRFRATGSKPTTCQRDH